MTRRRLLVLLILSFGYELTAARPASAQAVEYSCKYFFKNPYQATDCLEALFSEDMPYVHGHLTMGSVPPGNGFSLGAVIEKPTHFVSPFAPTIPPDVRDKDPFPLPLDPDTKERPEPDPGGRKSLLVPRLGAAISTNGSWIVSGTADWLPGIYKFSNRSETPLRPGLPPITKPCHKVLSFCTESVLAVHFEGSLLGFLFGIPRTIQSEDKSKDEYRQVVNTNLEQISDWLTKILVGVGLTQLNNLPVKIWVLADRLKSGLNDNQAITTCVVLNFLVCGFFAGYLLTRLFLAGAFTAAGRTELLLAKADQVSQQFTAAGQYKKAIETLEVGLKEINESTPKTQKRDIYERLTYNYLYQDPPDGFTKAIDLGKKYVTEEPDTPSAKIWANLALAYGQQYRWETEHEKRGDILKTARDQALRATQESMKLEPRMRSLFQMVWDPDDPTKISTEENDLEVFYKDQEFVNILKGSN